MSLEQLFDPPRAPANWDATDAREQLQLRCQTAVLLELTTIPLYLFALYSMKPIPENNESSEALRSIVKEEMLHLALAGNIMRAIGGKPKLYEPPYVPTYPRKMFYGEAVTLDLIRATEDQISNFIIVERPEINTGLARTTFLGDYNTISEFYADIKDGLETLDKKLRPGLFDPSSIGSQFSPQDGEVWDGDGLQVITDIKGALKSLELIVEQGEGGPGNTEESHYQKFKAMRHANIQCYPVIDHPVASDHLDEKIRLAMRASDAAYAYLRLTIETVWAYEGADAATLQRGISPVMAIMRSIAQLLVSQKLVQTEDTHAGPPFNHYAFTTRKSAYEEFGSLVREVIAAYPGQSPLKHTNKKLEQVVDVGHFIGAE